MPSSLFIPFLLLSLFDFSASDSSSEGYHLNEFKKSLSNFNPSSWKENSGKTFSPCIDWQHVTCTNDSITSLSLPGVGAKGLLSDDISYLSNLILLDLQNNSFYGSINPVLANLKNLKILNLNLNNFSGNIPESLGSLNLTQLGLENNNLSGFIPSTLNKYPCSSFTGNSLLKNVTVPFCANEYSPPPLAPSPSAPKNSKKSLLGPILGSLAAVFVVLSFLAFLYLRKKQKKQGQQNIPAITALTGDVLDRLGQVKKFSFQEVSNATNKFNESNLIGQGGAGKVYRGTLQDESQIAVKRLKVSGGARWQNEFVAEVRVISNAIHRNLMRLIGYCVDSNERMLIYPLMTNGSVAAYLQGSRPSENPRPLLTWQQRMDVAIQVGRALSYMHNDCQPPLIHRDVKSANVLLNADMEASLGDFGLAVSALQDGEQRRGVRGTIGYIAPESFLTGEMNVKTDVYGYGVFLLELVTGKLAHCIVTEQEEEGTALNDWVMRIVQERRVRDIIDTRLPRDATFDLTEMERLTHVGLLCMQQAPDERPTIAQCIATLEQQGTSDIVNLWREQEVLHIQDSIVAANAQSILNSASADPYNPSVELFQLVGPR